MLTFQQENNQLVNSFLERTYFKAWKEPTNVNLQNFSRAEIYLSSKCNLKCKYCYHTNFGEQLYSSEIISYDRILQNLELLCDWWIENKMAPKIDFFSGEPFVQKLGFDALDLILDKFADAEKKPVLICAPTNFTFILNSEITKKVERLIEKSKKIGIRLALSASFDGKYCEENRPSKIGIDNRDDEYYDKCFKFAVKHKFGFHPMVYSELIENWVDNFLWFQSYFKKYDLPFFNIYLLEVRNVEWTDWQIKEYMKFIEFLIEWTFKHPCKSDPKKFMKFLFTLKGYNILSAPLTNTGRGIGCSLQSCLYIRMGDLAIVPCHRTSYPQNTLAKFIVENNKIVGIEAVNPELLIGTKTFHYYSQPQCEVCTIKYLCQAQCLGSMLEVTGDMFSPIPMVCKLFHAKMMAMIKGFKKVNMYKNILNYIDERKAMSFRFIEKIMEE